VLRQEWGFQGIAISDYGAIREIMSHGTALDGGAAVRQALSAGVDIDLESNFFSRCPSPLSTFACQLNTSTTRSKTNGFAVVRIYFDAAKSGLILRRRARLKQLLRDVVTGTAPYKAILVYDVSRWGRYQDTDESEHHEFLCRSAGVPVHYCGETFANNGTFPRQIVKAPKRTMAGEYRRELSVKVLAGQKRLARMGFKQGGFPGYGLRRMLISADKVRKQLLTDGERSPDSAVADVKDGTDPARNRLSATIDDLKGELHCCGRQTG
jgi:DNA invertase Pin-like site-specific DNA recombinase